MRQWRNSKQGETVSDLYMVKIRLDKFKAVYITLLAMLWFILKPYSLDCDFYTAALYIKTHLSVCRYLACMISVTRPFKWHHAMTLNCDLLQGQIFSHVGDHITLNWLVYFISCWCIQLLLAQLVQREPWINVQILKKAWNFAEMLNMTTLNILAIVPSEIWSDTRFILSWKMWN